MSHQFRSRSKTPERNRSQSPRGDRSHERDEVHTTAQRRAARAQRPLPHLAPAAPARTVSSYTSLGRNHRTMIHENFDLQAPSGPSNQVNPASSASQHRAAPHESNEPEFSHSRNLPVPTVQEMEGKTSWELAIARYPQAKEPIDAWSLLAYAKAADREGTTDFYNRYGHGHFHCRIESCKHHPHESGFAGDGKTPACTTGMTQRALQAHWKEKHSKDDNGKQRWLYACINEHCPKRDEFEHGHAGLDTLTAHMAAFGGSSKYRLPEGNR